MVHVSSARGIAALLLALLLTGCRPAGEAVPDFEVTETSIAELQAALLAGRTRCTAVVAAHLARIEAYDAARGLGAITEVNPAALTEAEALDRALARGEAPGPLFCVPLLVKDNFETEGMAATAGSIALAAHRPARDAFMVQRLRAAGAIVLARTNMGEWAFSPRQTVSSSYGTTANAYALERTPAGSSGGTASGVAASFGVAGLGTDTGNSIRGPASHLALVGIRSTLGLTSRSGIVPLALDRDVAGPMARSVEDAARLFSVIAGFDPEDPYTEAARGRDAVDYLASLRRDSLEGRRLGVLWPHSDPADADPEVTMLFEQALTDLERLGAELVRGWEIPGYGELVHPGLFCRRFRYDLGRYLDVLGERAPFHDVTDLLESGLFDPANEESLRRALESPRDQHPAEAEPPCPEYADHPGRQALLAAVLQAMAETGVDALVFPTWSHPPAPLASAVEDYRGDNSQELVPLAGLPAITVPMGYSYGELPAGLQLVARPWEEGLLFAMAYAYEQDTRHRRPPRGFPPLIR